MRFTPVALFMGAAMSITAFPVLARILTERNLHKTKVGAIAITCAAVDDVTAWCMLAFVVGVARVRRDAAGADHRGAVGRLRADRCSSPSGRSSAGSRPSTTARGGSTRTSSRSSSCSSLASAWATEKIGIHALFGAFLMGAVMPKGTRFVRTAQREARGLHRRLPPADLLRLHRPQDADRPARTAASCGWTRASSSWPPAPGSSAARRWRPARAGWGGASRPPSAS